MTALLALYAAGVIVGLLCVDGSVVTKIGLAIVWPLGLVAFALTIATLVGVAAIAFPMFGVLLAFVLLGGWLLM